MRRYLPRLPISLRRVVFVTGFSRGGSSWLCDCIASHPDFSQIRSELDLFDERRTKDDYRRNARRTITRAAREAELRGPCFVHRTMGMAERLPRACMWLPECTFLFVIRDPRDVFVSQKRGNPDWLTARSRTIGTWLKPAQLDYLWYQRAAHRPNLLLIRYEDLHQRFPETIARVFRFIEARADPAVTEQVFEATYFPRLTGRKHVEKRHVQHRRGVIGDWHKFLSKAEKQWVTEHEFWGPFLKKHDYARPPVTYESILLAMKQAGVQDLDEPQVLARRHPRQVRTVLLMHDIDLLTGAVPRQSILETARIEARLGMHALYNFLPLDDMRYQPLKPQEIMEIIAEIRRINPLASIGLHLNATERFVPKDAPELGDDHPDMAKAVAYLHQQVDDYEAFGLKLHIATAHGYGRDKKRPNNYSKVLVDELARRGVYCWDGLLRPALIRRVKCRVNLTDVGGALTVDGLPHLAPADDPESYRNLPAPAFIRFLTHPGNFPVTRPLPLAVRNVRQRELPSASAGQRGGSRESEATPTLPPAARGQSA